ncbi:MAG: hypothetical protein QXJ21_03225 [Thermofilum sp.]
MKASSLERLGGKSARVACLLKLWLTGLRRGRVAMRGRVVAGVEGFRGACSEG